MGCYYCVKKTNLKVIYYIKVFFKFELIFKKINYVNVYIKLLFKNY